MFCGPSKLRYDVKETKIPEGSTIRVIIGDVQYLIYPANLLFTTEKNLLIIDVSAIYVLTTNLNLGDSSGAHMAR